MRNCKSIESTCLSMLTIQINDWSTFWHVYCCHVFYFFVWDSQYVQAYNNLLWRAGLTGLAFYGSGIACLLSWLSMVNAGWLGSIQSESFLHKKFIIFQGCPTKQAAFLTGQPTPYKQLLIWPLLLVPECYFAYNSEFLKFWAHFFQDAVFIGCNIFFSSFSYLFELIFAF